MNHSSTDYTIPKAHVWNLQSSFLFRMKLILNYTFWRAVFSRINTFFHQKPRSLRRVGMSLHQNSSLKSSINKPAICLDTSLCLKISKVILDRKHGATACWVLCVKRRWWKEMCSILQIFSMFSPDVFHNIRW